MLAVKRKSLTDICVIVHVGIAIWRLCDTNVVTAVWTGSEMVDGADQLVLGKPLHNVLPLDVRRHIENGRDGDRAAILATLLVKSRHLDSKDDRWLLQYRLSDSHNL